MNDYTDTVLEADFLGHKIVMYESANADKTEIRAFADSEAKHVIVLEDSLPMYIEAGLDKIKQLIRNAAP